MLEGLDFGALVVLFLLAIEGATAYGVAKMVDRYGFGVLHSICLLSIPEPEGVDVDGGSRCQPDASV